MNDLPPKTAIFIPTFKRPNNLDRVLSNIHRNTDGEYQIYFCVEDNDHPTVQALVHMDQKFIFNDGKQCYAGAINTAYKQTTEPYFFCGADDLNFHEGWLGQALQEMKNGIKVVGTNDMYNPDVLAGLHATHYLVSRDYIQTMSGRVDSPDTVLYEYDHNYTDTEFISVARSRNVFKYCPTSVVEHLHWAWGKAPMDETYQKGFKADAHDRAIFEERTKLWLK